MICASVNEIEDLIGSNEVQFTLYFETLDVNFKNYSQPVQYFITEEFRNINPNLLKKTFFLRRITKF